MNILDPIFYRMLFYNFRPVISPGHNHNIIKHCVFLHVGVEKIIMGCPNLVQGDSY
jgi:hypothetical protein